MSSSNARTLVIGGGLVGSLAALRLADAGVPVTVLERSVPGAEASSAAAGILAAQSEAEGDPAHFALAMESRALHQQLAVELRERAGLDVGWRRCGVIELARDDASLDAMTKRFAWQRARGLPVDALDARALRTQEPSLDQGFAGGLYFPDDGALDPGRLVNAVAQTAALAGVEFRQGATVRGVRVEGDRARGVDTDQGLIEADCVVVCAGAWSGMIQGALPDPASVRPVRGQIVTLEARPVPLRSVVFAPGGYLVPRPEGSVLVGSTLEHVGFLRGVTAAGMSKLLALAVGTVPSLRDAVIQGSWSNFRPHSASGAPLVGRVAEGLVVATGHYRSGILLAPVTAEIVRDLVVHGRARPGAEVFSPKRVS